MSFPVNPMDKFRSVSYQHVLLIANNTEIVRKFLDSNNDDINLTDITNVSLGEAVKPSSSDSSSSSDPGMFVVIDTRKNSNYILKGLTYVSNLGVGLPNQTQVISGKLEIQVVDPFGISFLNYIQHLIDEQLKTSIDGIVWLLQTFFVGHNDDTSTEVITTSAIPMILISMQVTQLTSSGGQYSLEFAPISSGAAGFIPQASYIRDNVNFVTDTSGSLKSAIQGLENQLNKNSRDWYKKIQPANLNEKAEDQKKTKKHGRLIQYMFTIPKSWESFKVEGKSDNTIEKDWQKLAADAKADAEKKASDAKSADTTKLKALQASGKTLEAAALLKSINDGKRYVTVLPHFTVDQALSEILKHCPEVAELASNKRRKEPTVGQPAKLYKTLSSITSDLDSVLLHWDIVEFELPHISPEAAKDHASAKWFREATSENPEKTPVNSMIFDYTFSGKNADIINFDMKILNANLLINNRTMISTKDIDATTANTDQRYDHNLKTPGEQIKNKDDIFLLREHDPVFKPEITGSQAKGMAFVTEGSGLQTKLRQEEIRTAADVYAASALNMKMKIRGNPNLMNVLTGKQPPHVKSLDILAETESIIGNFDDVKNTKRFTESLFVAGASTEVGSREYYRHFISQWVQGIQSDLTASKSGLPAARHLASYPLFVKVNVYAPNVDFGGIFIDSNKYAKKFWYEGWFMVLSIEQSFIEGKFEQDLVMGAYNVYENATMVTQGNTASSVTTPKNQKESISSSNTPVEETSFSNQKTGSLSSGDKKL